jgi:TM2 domain-containing membrane protein YozV
MSDVGSVNPTATPTGEPISPKSRAAAAILAWFLGIFGVHRFYVGKVGTGIAMIFTLGGLGIWALIDFIMIVVGSFRDKENRLLVNW